MNTIEQLRKRFKESGLSVYYLAKRAGLAVSIAQKFAAGGDIRTATLDKMAEALDYKVTLERRKGR